MLCVCSHLEKALATEFTPRVFAESRAIWHTLQSSHRRASSQTFGLRSHSITAGWQKSALSLCRVSLLEHSTGSLIYILRSWTTRCAVVARFFQTVRFWSHQGDIERVWLPESGTYTGKKHSTFAKPLVLEECLTCISLSCGCWRSVASRITSDVVVGNLASRQHHRRLAKISCKEIIKIWTISHCVAPTRPCTYEEAEKYYNIIAYRTHPYSLSSVENHVFLRKRNC